MCKFPSLPGGILTVESLPICGCLNYRNAEWSSVEIIELLLSNLKTSFKIIFIYFLHTCMHTQTYTHTHTCHSARVKISKNLEESVIRSSELVALKSLIIEAHGNLIICNVGLSSV